jgi:hypothetical protein
VTPFLDEQELDEQELDEQGSVKRGERGECSMDGKEAKEGLERDVGWRADRTVPAGLLVSGWRDGHLDSGGRLRLGSRKPYFR